MLSQILKVISREPAPATVELNAPRVQIIRERPDQPPRLSFAGGILRVLARNESRCRMNLGPRIVFKAPEAKASSCEISVPDIANTGLAWPVFVTVSLVVTGWAVP